MKSIERLFISLLMIVAFCTDASVCEDDMVSLKSSIIEKREARNFNSAVEFAQSLEVLASKCIDSKEASNYLLFVADTYMQVGDKRDEAASILQALLAMKSKNKRLEHTLHVESYKSLANIAFIQKEYDKAINYWHQLQTIISQKESLTEYEKTLLKQLESDIKFTNSLINDKPITATTIASVARSLAVVRSCKAVLEEQSDDACLAFYFQEQEQFYLKKVSTLEQPDFESFEQKIESLSKEFLMSDDWLAQCKTAYELSTSFLQNVRLKDFMVDQNEKPGIACSSNQENNKTVSKIKRDKK